jgi:hypothetical protein
MKMTIKTVSGGVRGEKGTGTEFHYAIEKETFLGLVGAAFDKEVEDYKAENVKSGGVIAQFLHAYGVSADKMERSGLNPFPDKGEEFTSENVEKWFEAVEFETPRQKKVAVPLEQRQAKWDATSAAMTGAGLDLAFVESAIGKRPVK